MTPICDHYAASYSTKQKEILGMGFNPPCVMQDNGPGHPVLSGKCQEFAWNHYEHIRGSCVLITTWVTVPCFDHLNARFGPQPHLDMEKVWDGGTYHPVSCFIPA